MESNSSTAGAVVSTGKENYSLLNPSNFDDTRNFLENLDPNFSIVNLKSFNSPTIIKSKKSAKKSDSRSPNPIRVDSPLLKKKIRERKFVIAKKKSRNEDLNSSAAGVVCEKCKKAIGKSSQCWCLAYQSLRASQEDFFDKRAELSNEIDVEKLNKHNVRDENERIKVNHVGQDTGIDNEGGLEGKDSSENNDEDVELILKRRRDKLLKEARESVPESGSGRVMHLVRAFENLHLIRKADDSGDEESEQVLDEKKGTKWGLPGLQQSTKVSNPQVYLPLYCPSDIFLTSESLSLGSTRSYSLDSSQGSFSTRTSARGGRSRRRSNESSGTFVRRNYKGRQPRATSQRPFMLQTEKRGRCEEEEFMKRLQERMEGKKKLQIPIASMGRLPLTTDEPECLVKPPVKENTRPIDVVLHSDIRAEERAEFDQQVARKISFIEQYRLERERQQKLAEEEEIRRLRKEIVPKAQPMPYFDRPFVPRRSTKHLTIPREPKFHVPQHKKIKCCSSCVDNCDGYNG
ncbi:microtubule-destabilizing protein 60-like isoform X2 [Primulina huaijiensis]|uniref:microtubule-destabilizing protein 60-like isoform X2 n=1 Tax=Primulina huaijiensis TaxID=1492673 RepID=UPI003CC74723